jgi:hypothetical protein
MTQASRKYGRREPKRAPAIQFKDIRTGATPAFPAAADYLSVLNGGWNMLGNDAAGDCVAVTWANVRRLVTAILASESYPSQSQVWKFYQTQNPDFDPNGSSDTNGPGSSADQGMDIQTALEDLVKNGGPDGVKAVAFAQVDHTNADEVKAAIAIFGSVWTGLNVLDINQTEFSDGEAWNYSSKSPVDGGHSVVTGGYGPAGAGQLSGDERFITWAEETSFTDSFWTHEVEEAWVVVWPEHLLSKEFEQGVNLTQLAADYQALTGSTLVIPVTPPAPPQPPSPPEDADAAWAAILKPWCAKVRTRADLVELKNGGLEWLTAKGL